MNRRTFSTSLLIADLYSRHGRKRNCGKARNVVLVDGLFADGSCWNGRMVRRFWLAIPFPV
jgi:hypothetical protein